MTDPDAFAQEWEAAWNSHDLDRIMAHYAETVVFRSRKAVPLTGAGEVVGKDALRDYWSEALTRQPDLKFTVTQVYVGHQMITLAYTNQMGRKAAETLWFNDAGQAIQAAACHAG